MASADKFFNNCPAAFTNPLNFVNGPIFDTFTFSTLLRMSMVISFSTRETLRNASTLKVFSPLISMMSAMVLNRSASSLFRDIWISYIKWPKVEIRTTEIEPRLRKQRTGSKADQIVSILITKCVMTEMYLLRIVKIGTKDRKHAQFDLPI
jgi:hypothetical protein